MAQKKITRKELLKDTDEFMTFSERAAQFVKEHLRQFQYLGITIGACLLIYLGINTYVNYINKKGQNAYNIAYYTVEKEIKPDEYQKHLKQTEESFNEVLNKYGMSKVSKLVLPQLAYIKFIKNEYNEAISLYEKFSNDLSDNTPYQSLTKIGLAASYEAQGELKKATEILKQIMDGPDNFFKELAMMSLARVYRLANQEDISKEILKEFIAKFKSSPYMPIAKAHLNKLP